MNPPNGLRRLSILGSTGSIGRSALTVLESLQSGDTGTRWELRSLAARAQGAVLAEQARRHHPSRIGLTDSTAVAELRAAFREPGVEILEGPSCLESFARDEQVDIVLGAVTGAAGLPSSLAAVEAGKILALANKEALVVAGELITTRAKATGAALLPVDSEHSAVFQAMRSGSAGEVRRIILTASGGPFRQRAAGTFKDITPAEALRHPTWQMGPKITIDSATLMNKALEIVEARWLFDLPVDRIDVVIHPQSIVHSMVEFCDGSVVAQMGAPDMKIPIQYALTWPNRRPGPGVRWDLSKAQSLEFHPPDMDRFPALRLGREAAAAGGTLPAVMNAANEEAVAAFLDGKIGFDRIVRSVEAAMRRHTLQEHSDLPALLAADRWAREEVRRGF